MYGSYHQLMELHLSSLLPEMYRYKIGMLISLQYIKLLPSLKYSYIYVAHVTMLYVYIYDSWKIDDMKIENRI